MSDSRQHQKPTPPLISTRSPTSAKPTLARAPRTVPARIRLPTAPSLLCMVGHLVELGRRCNCSPPPQPPLLLPPALLPPALLPPMESSAGIIAPRMTHMAPPCTTASHRLPTVAVIQIPPVTILQTGFDREHADNQCFPGETKRKENIIWTEGERAKAEAGEVVQDLDDLRSKVR